MQATKTNPKRMEAIIRAERAEMIADLELMRQLQTQEERLANDYSFDDEHLQEINGSEEDNWSVILYRGSLPLLP